jgi:archaellum biogenesis ATPase FlaH
MNLDKKTLKQLVEQSKPYEMLVLSVDSLEKNSLQMCQKEIDKFIKKQEDYVITVIKR